MFRFTIREILWLTVIVALAICWWTDRHNARRRQLDDQERIAAQEQLLKAKDLQLAGVRTRLEGANAEEDKMKIDVASPGFYHRLAHPS